MHSERLPAHDILIRNISARGIGAGSRTGTPPLLGERVCVRLPDGQTIVGTVRWVAAQDFGIALNAAISLPDLFASLHKAKLMADAGADFVVKSRHRVTTWRPNADLIRRI
jgi:hypothetical protein